MLLRITLLHNKADLPAYAYEDDSGMDLKSIETITINPGDRKLVKTGVSIELPLNTEAQIRPRSGLAVKHGVTVLNAPGTIDEGYRGEIKVLLINLGNEPFEVTPEMRIAQMIICPVIRPKIIESNRGTKGFGSTGFD
jgi:dUTP pyrophosphatase